MIIVTNNIMVSAAYEEGYNLKFFQVTHRELLCLVRDYVHKGHRLLTHPLSGSIKPTETPFKSVVLSEQQDGLDYRSLTLIEEAIRMHDKLYHSCNVTNYTRTVLEDFRRVDLALLDSAIK
ncbi:GrdX family protein [Eubacteriales bacterium DFI.9.88]|nr:GrdX family protein [Eubacteriales bacterium DFI.9.88]